MTVSPRQNTEQVLHVSRYSFSFSTPGNSTMNPAGGGVNFGAIPAGALVKSTEIYVTDAFNTGTTVTLNVGFAGNATDLVSAGNLAGAALTTTAAPIAAAKTTYQATSKTGTQLYATLNAAGTLATSGNCTVAVSFLPDFTNGIVGTTGG